MSTARGSRRRRRAPDHPRLAAGTLLVAASAPLALGGVHDAYALAAAAATFGLLVAAAVRAPTSRGWPFALPAAALLALWALVQTVPGLGAPGGTAEPGTLAADVAFALDGTGVEPRWALAPTLPDARTAAVRLAVLTGLLLLGRLVPWRRAATALAATATLSALAIYVHAATKTDAIYGLYRARQVDLGDVPYWFGTFVSPNHQAAFLLLGLGCALARVVDLAGTTGRDPVPRAGDRLVLHAAAAVTVLPALGATLSRAGIVLAGVLCAAAGVPVLRAVRTRGRGDPRSAPVHTQRIVVAGLACVVAFAAAIPLAWPALSEMAAWLDDASKVADEPKVRLLVESLPMFRLAPVTGIGAGTFADLWARYATDLRAAWATHLESGLLGPALAHGLVGAVAVAAAAAIPVVAFARLRRAPNRAGRAVVALTLLLSLIHI